ncbi:hypothetical protein C2857_003582 [Epichloe festucae Fl1]|uniref:N-acetyltransferase domain-containing protein n=1 Tax=Epichloe festucae (strain Fl1) TaxID=877507 RepID=A0A7S9PTS2_EPIFF|nr:hypothetical protein C2857_003582 [Epichloe festucae Fl1]
MSLPTTKPIQPSIRSFFTTNTPKYAPPPGQSPPSSHIAIRHPPATQQAKDLAIPPLPTIPDSASIRIPTDADIAPLRRINSLLLQVSYAESFYAYAVNNPFSRVITWSQDGQEPKVIGGIVCRVEDISPKEKNKSNGDKTAQNIYIRSLCLLSPYRSMGLARAALEHVLSTVAANHLNVASVTAHVWTENEDGLRWYEGRGFARAGQPLRGYYLKLRPDTAWLVRRDVSRSGNGSSEREEAGAMDNRSVSTSVTAAVVNLPPLAAPLPGVPASSTKSTPPPPSSGTSRPKSALGQSYQNQRPDMEWNDVPADMAPPMAPLRKTGSESVSATSSRSSSSAGPRKKRDRSYPAAAFGANQ